MLSIKFSMTHGVGRLKFLVMKSLRKRSRLFREWSVTPQPYIASSSTKKSSVKNRVPISIRIDDKDSFFQILQNLGKADKTTDEIFEEHLQNFNTQQVNATRLHKDINNYLRCIRGDYNLITHISDVTILSLKRKFWVHSFIRKWMFFEIRRNIIFFWLHPH